MKEVRTKHYYFIATLLRIHVIGGQRSVRIAPPSLPPHHSDPAARDFQRTGIVAEGGTAHPDDTLGGALQPGWRAGSPWLLDRCDEEAGREEQSSPTFDLQ